tara:strand:- start:94 stop:537 length:444 start_codon:yes stop_codon:yes gene_type:complete
VKNFLYLLVFVFLTNCANTTISSSCKIKINKSIAKNDPDWFKEKENQEYNYIVKNKEFSGDGNLAKNKNILISEIILANKIADDFMNCEDQNKALYTIRNSASDGLGKLQNGKIIKNLIQGYKISNNETIEENGKFTNYLRIIKLRK